MRAIASGRLGVPHDAETVLTNRLGDCKDHTALFQALLAAKNIESIPVLVNSGSSFKLPPVPTLGVLNHVISYLPGLDLYADSSSEVTPFGLLPMSVSGKPVVHTTHFTGIRRTPPTDYRANASRMKWFLKYRKTGSAEGETQNEETGILAGGIKAAMALIQPNMEDIIVRNILAGRGYNGNRVPHKARTTGHPGPVRLWAEISAQECLEPSRSGRASPGSHLPRTRGLTISAAHSRDQSCHERTLESRVLPRHLHRRVHPPSAQKC